MAMLRTRQGKREQQAVRGLKRRNSRKRFSKAPRGAASTKTGRGVSGVIEPHAASGFARA